MTNSSLLKRALLLSYLTVGYNILEGFISMLAGYLAGSIALVGFGLDSFVEFLFGGIMIWRFRQHADLTPEEEERREKLAIKLVGYTFFVLAAYILYESLKKLIFQEAPAPSLLGIIIALVSLILMPLLFFLKYRTGADQGSASHRADAKQTLAALFFPWLCSWVSASIIFMASGRRTLSLAS